MNFVVKVLKWALVRITWAEICFLSVELEERIQRLQVRCSELRAEILSSCSANKSDELCKLLDDTRADLQSLQDELAVWWRCYVKATPAGMEAKLAKGQSLLVRVQKCSKNLSNIASRFQRMSNPEQESVINQEIGTS